MLDKCSAGLTCAAIVSSPAHSFKLLWGNNGEDCAQFAEAEGDGGKDDEWRTVTTISFVLYRHSFPPRRPGPRHEEGRPMRKSEADVRITHCLWAVTRQDREPQSITSRSSAQSCLLRSAPSLLMKKSQTEALHLLPLSVFAESSLKSF